MNYKIHFPSYPLNKFIKLIWAFESDESTCLAEPLIIPPTGFVEIIFDFKETLNVEIPDKNKSEKSGFLICGQRNSYSSFNKVSSEIISVLVNPEASALLLGIPANEISDIYLNPSDLWGQTYNDLKEKLSECISFIQKVECLENFFTERLKDIDFKIDSRIISAVEIVKKHCGNLAIKNLAEHLNLSPRQIERIFLQNIGLSPKEFSKVLKFQYSLFLKQRDEKISLTNLSVSAGYFDQSHFIKEFRLFSGLTPSEYFSKCGAFSDYYSL